MESTPCDIRPYGGLELADAEALHGLCFPAAWDRPWSRQAFAEILAMPGTFGLMARAKAGGDAMGLVVARVAADEAEILTIGVRVDCRRRGLGAALLAAPSWTSTLNFDPLIAPNGANPTTDAAGEIAVDTSATTGAGIRFYADAAYLLPAYQSVSSTIKGSVAADDYPLWKFPYAITIKAIKVYVVGGTNVIGGLDECTGTLGVCTSVTAVDAVITGLAATEVADDGTLTNGAIAAGNYIQWHTTSVSGTNTSVTITMYYTVDQVN